MGVCPLLGRHNFAQTPCTQAHPQQLRKQLYDTITANEPKHIIPSSHMLVSEQMLAAVLIIAHAS